MATREGAAVCNRTVHTHGTARGIAAGGRDIAAVGGTASLPGGAASLPGGAASLPGSGQGRGRGIAAGAEFRGARHRCRGAVGIAAGERAGPTSAAHVRVTGEKAEKPFTASWVTGGLGGEAYLSSGKKWKKNLHSFMGHRRAWGRGGAYLSSGEKW